MPSAADPAQAYPVPATESVRPELPAAWLAADAELFDATGRVVRRFRPAATCHALRSPGQSLLRLVFE